MHSDRTANVLVCVLAVVRCPVESELGVPRLAFAVRKPNAPLDSFRRYSVKLVANKVSTDVLSPAVESPTLCIDDLPAIAAVYQSRYRSLHEADPAYTQAQKKQIGDFKQTPGSASLGWQYLGLCTLGDVDPCQGRSSMHSWHSRAWR